MLNALRQLGEKLSVAELKLVSDHVSQGNQQNLNFVEVSDDGEFKYNSL